MTVLPMQTGSMVPHNNSFPQSPFMQTTTHVSASSSRASDETPGPRGLNALTTMYRFRSDPLGTLCELTKQYGDAVAFRLGPFRVVLFNRPELVGRVFQAPSGDFSRNTYMNSLATRVLGENSLVANDGERWVQQRRILQPVFRAKRFDSYADVMRTEIDAVLDDWEPNVASGKSVDVSEATARLSLRIASRALFGIQLDPKQEATIDHEFLALNEDLTRRLSSLLPLPPVLPLPADRNWRRSMTRLNATIDDIIQQRRAQQAEGSGILDLLINARDEETDRRLSDAEIRDHVKTFMLGGYETTAHALAWSAHLLSHNPDEQTRLAELAVKGFDASKDHARAVFEETLRLYPPGWLTARRTERTQYIGRYRLPKGSDVLLCPYTMHRHADYWDSPLEFRPDRFLSTTQRRPKFSFFPFGGGPQACIGKAFALLQGQLMLTSLVRRYEMRPCPDRDAQPEALLTLRAKHGIHVTLHPRSHQR